MRVASYALRVKYWLLDTGYLILDAGFRVASCALRGVWYWMLGCELRVAHYELRVKYWLLFTDYFSLITFHCWRKWRKKGTRLLPVNDQYLFWGPAKPVERFPRKPVQWPWKRPSDRHVSGCLIRRLNLQKLSPLEPRPKFFFFDLSSVILLTRRGKMLPNSEFFGRAFEHFL